MNSKLLGKSLDILQLIILLFIVWNVTSTTKEILQRIDVLEDSIGTVIASGERIKEGVASEGFKTTIDKLDSAVEQVFQKDK